MGTLRIQLFGGIRIVPDEQPHGDIRIPRSAKVLLAYLLLQPGRYCPREVLVDLSWGDRSEEQARSCLSTALWRLRAALEPDGVERGTYLVTTVNGEVGFNWQSDHWLDLEAFERRANRFLAMPAAVVQLEHARDMENVLPLYTGELLEGLYDDWALRERERLRSLHLNCLVRLLRFYRKEGFFEKSILYGQEILREDPLREEIHRDLMRVYQENGQRSQALRQYEQCRAVLDVELGIPPMQETQALYRQILASGGGSDEGPAAPGRAPDLHLAMRQLGQAARNLDLAMRELRRAVQAMEGQG